jgi:phosphoribosylaminoimidazole-succinocarboxamide synthase
MKIVINTQYAALLPVAAQLVAQLVELNFEVELSEFPQFNRADLAEKLYLELLPGEQAGSGWAERHKLYYCPTDPAAPTLIEQVLRWLPLDFEKLPLLIEGESKEVRLWTDKVVVSRFKPTVYSYTMNRSGEAPGTEQSRLRFSAALFRRLSQLPSHNGVGFSSAFLAELVGPQGSLMVQRRVEVSNLEVRIKRYHIGSPLHRYRYTERYQTVQQNGAPLGRWSRLEQPLVCFDWRHPLWDEQGNRLADEPLPDDYAGVWMENVGYAKTLARQTFLWLEKFFARGGVCLVDMCLLIDRTGRIIYGEISPDCMRLRLDLNHPELAEAGAKDLWRIGGSAEQLQQHYEMLYERIFGEGLESIKNN